MRGRLLTAAALLTGLTVSLAVKQPVASQSTPIDGLVVEAQNYAVAPGALAHFELLVNADVPEIAPTTTTTTSTTTTTTTTTTVPVTDPAAPATGEPGGPPASTGDTPDNGSVSPESTIPATTTTIDPGPEMIVQIRAHRRLTNRSQVAASLVGDPGAVIDILQFDLADVSRFDEATGQRRLMLDVPINSGVADVDELDLLEPGLYPVTIQIRRDSTLVTDHTTFLEVIDVAGIGRGPFRFAVLATLHDPGPDPTPTEIAALSDGLSEIAELAAATDAPISLAVPPHQVGVALAADVALTNRLGEALGPDDGIVVLPEFELDPSAAAAAGLKSEFQSRFVRGEAQLAELFPDQIIATSAWPTTSPLTAPGAALLRDAGVPMLVVPFERYSGYQGSLLGLSDTTLLLNARLPDDSTLRMLVVDPVTDLLDPDVPSENSPAEDAVFLMATTAAQRYQLSPDLRTMVLTTGDLGAPNPDILGFLEQFVAEHPEYSFQRIDQVVDANALFVDGAPLTVSLDEQPAISLTPRVERIAAVRLDADDVASMLPGDDPRPSGWSSRLDIALSTGLTAAEANVRISEVESEIDAIRAGVQPPEAFPFTIPGRQVDIPVRIENTSDTALRVIVRLDAEKLSFDPEGVEAVLEPNAITAVPIPVTARANGVFPVLIQVFTPSGTALTEPVELTARVSTFAGLGRVVTVAAVLVLASWWFSYFRRRRKAELERGIDDARDRHPALGEEATRPGAE